MAERLQVYKCNMCGNIVEVLHGAAGSLSCCGKDMVLLKENTTDAATEKHVPVITKSAEGYTVAVGSVEHPMVDSHYIEWIELLADGISYIAFLKPGDKPQAFFPVTAAQVSAREFCNLHGLWKA
ncbi:MAG: desulfoferrodoxin [Desulfocapsaceae bacterium]|nr:desulfoferrodoxin [Desulfocapsaceae bacterium]